MLWKSFRPQRKREGKIAAKKKSAERKAKKGGKKARAGDGEA